MRKVCTDNRRPASAFRAPRNARKPLLRIRSPQMNTCEALYVQVFAALPGIGATPGLQKGEMGRFLPRKTP